MPGGEFFGVKGVGEAEHRAGMLYGVKALRRLRANAPGGGVGRD